MRRFVSYGPAMIVLLTAAAALFAVPAIVQRINIAQTTAEIRLARLQLEDDDILERLNQAIRNVATSVEPSVVHIDAGRSRGGQRGLSQGAGWVFDSKGHIVTNAHVVGNSRRIEVQFADGRIVSAVPVGTDEYTDIAVLRATSSLGMFPIARATDEPPHIGDRVFAFGSPFGFKFSMSQGIVSGLGRNPSTAVELSGFANFIQTDAAVNPGNSGGPLVDVKGRLIGMNVAIATGSSTDGSTDALGQSAGISFAIPLATIESIATQIIEGGQVARGYFGINYPPDTVVEVAQDDLSRVGVPVSSVEPSGPAERGGMRPNDVITNINGQRLNNPEILRSAIAPLRPGARMKVRVWRSDAPNIKEQIEAAQRRPRTQVFRPSEDRSVPLQGRFVDLTITLGEFPEPQLVNQLLIRYGISVGMPEDPTSTPMVRGGWNTADGRNVIDRGSGAYRDGFRSGQTIVAVEGQGVDTASELFVMLAQAGFLDAKTVQVTVDDRKDGEKKLSIRLAR